MVQTLMYPTNSDVVTVLKVEGPDLMGSARSGISSELCLSVLATASFFKAFNKEYEQMENGLLRYLILEKCVE